MIIKDPVQMLLLILTLFFPMVPFQGDQKKALERKGLNDFERIS